MLKDEIDVDFVLLKKLLHLDCFLGVLLQIVILEIDVLELGKVLQVIPQNVEHFLVDFVVLHIDHLDVRVELQRQEKLVQSLTGQVVEGQVQALHRRVFRQLLENLLHVLVRYFLA